MKLSDFFSKYNDEEACKHKWKQIREQEGITCKKCGCKEHYWQQSIWQWECKECKFRTTMRSGTVMEASKLPFRYWLAAMAFLTTTKKSISALELQRQLGHKRYEPIWAMLHKLRLVMRYRDSQYQLTEYIELDEGFVSTSDRREKKQEEDNQQGRGSDRKASVLVAVESSPVENPKNPKKPNQIKHIKMTVMDDLSGTGIGYEVQKSINEKAHVHTDGYRGYSKLKQKVRIHQVSVLTGKSSNQIDKAFPWVHKVISNLKRLLLGVNHSVSGDYLQNYLDEYCYKFNRRYFGENLFDRLLIASVSSTWYDNIYKNG